MPEARARADPDVRLDRGRLARQDRRPGLLLPSGSHPEDLRDPPACGPPRVSIVCKVVFTVRIINIVPSL